MSSHAPRACTWGFPSYASPMRPSSCGHVASPMRPSRVAFSHLRCVHLVWPYRISDASISRGIFASPMRPSSCGIFVRHFRIEDAEGVEPHARRGVYAVNHRGTRASEMRRKGVGKTAAAGPGWARRCVGLWDPLRIRGWCGDVSCCILQSPWW